MQEITIQLGDYVEEEKRRQRRGARAVAAIAVLGALLVIAFPRPQTHTTTTTSATTAITSTTATTTTITATTATTATTAPPPPAHLASLPPELAFPTQLAGTASAAQLVRIHNDGGEPLAIAAIAARGDGFHLSHDCPQTLAINDSCSAAIVFAPMTAGTQRGQLTIDAGGATTAVALRGVARPAPPVDLGTLDFGSAPTDAKRPPRPLRFANGRPAAVALGKTIVNGPFAAVADGCSGVRVAPGGTCDVNLALTTTDAGTFAGKLQILDAQNNLVAFSALAAEATPPRIVEVPPAKIDIVPRDIAFTRQTRERRPIVLTNHGGKATTITVEANGLSFGFVVDTKPCDGTTLAPGETCTMSVTALPIAYERHSTIRILVSYDGHTDEAAVAAK